MIRLLFVHDDTLLRCGLTSLLGAEVDIEISSLSWEALTRAEPPPPGTVRLADVTCPGFARYADETVRQTGAEDEHGLVVLAPAGRPGLLTRAFEARALGYVSKEAPPQRLLDAIRAVAKGGRYVDDALAYDFLSASRMPLTPRELRVLALAADGAPVPEIAGELWLAEGTVRNYLAAVIRKTGARNRVDAIRIARSAGWV
ncbi:response regulator transcription factor [Streptomyces marincola]|uniref:response regulator transcription factor n=1 Tax=Streptomyces marincola TaxID=2878388 RepID=UPI001CF3846F|nr:response regulator transcription factor [Streptomyces marincola]UCM87642.1 response regulator transcription factor [Streptomyces marincola]